jgi:acetyl esterase
LVYPVTAPSRGTELESYTQNADGYLLTRAAMEWFWDHYLASPGDGRNPYASPLHAPDLTGLPPAMVVTAQFDPLRDEDRAYARRLRKAGVAVKSTTTT